MMSFYIIMSLAVGVIWLINKDINSVYDDNSKSTIWVSQVEMQKLLQELKATNAGRILITPFFFLYNFLVLPWVGVGFVYKKIRNALFRQEEPK